MDNIIDRAFLSWISKSVKQAKQIIAARVDRQLVALAGYCLLSDDWADVRVADIKLITCSSDQHLAKLASTLIHAQYLV